jgi:two-component system, cell cycle response regulator
VSSERPMSFDEGEDRTAVVNLADLRAAPSSANRDRHLLVRIHGSDLGQIFVLKDHALRIGRHPGSEVWLTDNGISRRHAELVFEGGTYVIEDLKSANGTFVQGERVTRRELKDGDLVQLGPSVLFRYSITDAEQEGMLRQLYEASVKDSLTGTYNREHFDARLGSELSYARRHNTQMSLILFDVDHFKSINDNHGHPAGDAVLIELVASVGTMLRAEDVLARYGGEEFAIVLRAIDRDGAGKLGERLRAAVEAMTIDVAGKSLKITVSVGCASLACCGDAVASALVACADRRLYAAKRGGRNRVVASD